MFAPGLQWQSRGQVQSRANLISQGGRAVRSVSLGHGSAYGPATPPADGPGTRGTAAGETEKCQFRTEKCQFRTEKCQF